MKRICRICNQIFQSEEDTDICNQCQLKQEQLEMDNFASSMMWNQNLWNKNL